MFRWFALAAPWQNSHKAVGEWAVNSEADCGKIKFTNSNAVLDARLISLESPVRVNTKAEWRTAPLRMKILEI